MATPWRGLALTGYGREEDLSLARDAGFDVHLTKPLTVEELASIIAPLQAPG